MIQVHIKEGCNTMLHKKSKNILIHINAVLFVFLTVISPAGK